MICMYFKNKLLVKKSAKTHVIYIDIVCYEFFSPHNFKICLFIYNTMEEPSIIGDRNFSLQYHAWFMKYQNSIIFYWFEIDYYSILSPCLR